MKENPIQKTINTLINIGLVLSGISVLLMTAIVFVEIISRSIFNYSTLIADEMAVYLNVAIVFFGLGYTFKTEGFIKINLLYSRLSDRVKHIMDTISVAFALVYSIVLFYFATIMVQRMYTYGTRSLFISKTHLYIPKSRSEER